MTCCATMPTSSMLCCRPAAAVWTRPLPVDWFRLLEWGMIALLGASAGLAGIWSLVTSL